MLTLKLNLVGDEYSAGDLNGFLLLTSILRRVNTHTHTQTRG
jgi:hypothetical protein